MEVMDHAFQIPTVHKGNFFYNHKKYHAKRFDIDWNYHLIELEVTQAFKLPIIKGNPFVKVNSN